MDLDRLKDLIKKYRENMKYYHDTKNAYNETECRDEYINPLLECFGWDVQNVQGISISLTMGAIFIPMVYLAGEDKTIVFLIISLICALGIATMLFNIPLFGSFILIGCSILLFIVSFPLTVGIFKKKEY